MKMFAPRICLGVALLIVGNIARVSAGDSESFKNKSDSQLFELMVGSLTDPENANKSLENGIRLPAGFWEMAPRDAAIALVEINHDPRKKMQISISAAHDLAPPDQGEVGLRWSDSRCMAIDPRDGCILLRYQAGSGSIGHSSVRSGTDATEKQIRAATTQTLEVKLTPQRARHLFETLWWLGHVEYSLSDFSFMVSTADGSAEFWVSPDSKPVEVTLFDGNIASRYRSGFNNDLYGTFVDFVLRQTLIDQGVDLGKATGSVGHFTMTSNEKFLAAQAPPTSDDPREIQKWITRMLGVLQDKKRESVFSDIVSELVPKKEPSRYPDQRIDEALMEFVRPVASAGMGGPFELSNTISCINALVARDNVEVFPLLLGALQRNHALFASSYSLDEILGAVTRLTEKHAEFRPEFRNAIAYVLALSDADATTDVKAAFIDAAWRGGLSDLRPQLERLKGSQPFSQTRRILLTWAEKNPLTRLKLDAIVEATSRYSGPDTLLRREFQELRPSEKTEMLEFVDWLGQQPVWFSDWSLTDLKKTFSIR